MALTTKVVGTQDPSDAQVETPTYPEEGSQDQPKIYTVSDIAQIRGRLILDYGDSGDGKSTRLHSLARFYYLKTGLPVRLVSAEDSTKKVFEDLVNAGIVQVVYLTDTKTPISTYERIVEGEWPTGEYEEQKITGLRR